MPPRVTIWETLVGRALIPIIEGHNIYRATYIQTPLFVALLSKLWSSGPPLSQVVVPASLESFRGAFVLVFLAFLEFSSFFFFIL